MMRGVRPSTVLLSPGALCQEVVAPDDLSALQLLSWGSGSAEWGSAAGPATRSARDLSWVSNLPPFKITLFAVKRPNLGDFINNN
jgi:hypothetical protein